jgi:hypothetical protein
MAHGLLLQLSPKAQIGPSAGMAQGVWCGVGAASARLVRVRGCS